MLKGEKVILRSVEPEDADMLFEWENDRDIWQISNTTKPFTKAMLRAYAGSDQDIYAHRQLRLIIDEKEHGKSIGCVDLFDFDPTHDRAGIGILIADTQFRNKGFASESIHLMIEYSFFTLNLHQLYCNVIAENSDSLQLFKRQGFKVTGEKKDWVKQGTNFKNELTLQLINS